MSLLTRSICTIARCSDSWWAWEQLGTACGTGDSVNGRMFSEPSLASFCFRTSKNSLNLAATSCWKLRSGCVPSLLGPLQWLPPLWLKPDPVSPAPLPFSARGCSCAFPSGLPEVPGALCTRALPPAGGQCLRCVRRAHGYARLLWAELHRVQASLCQPPRDRGGLLPTTGRPPSCFFPRASIILGPAPWACACHCWGPCPFTRPPGSPGNLSVPWP